MKITRRSNLKVLGFITFWPWSIIQGCSNKKITKHEEDPTPENIRSTSFSDKVKEIIIDQLGVDLKQVTENARFVEDLGADSLDSVELVMTFEEEFDIEMPDEDVQKLLTVGNLMEYLNYKLSIK